MALSITSRIRLDEVTADIIENIEMIEESREDIDRIAMELYKNYNSIRSKRFYDGDSDIFVPFSFMMVETVVAKHMRSIFAEAVPVPFAGVGPEDKDQAEKIRALLQMQQKGSVKLQRKVQDYIRAKCIFPKAYAEIHWRTDYRTVTRPKVETIDPNKGAIEEGGIPKPTFQRVTSEEKVVATYDCWDWKNLDYFDVGVHPNTPDGDIQRAPFTYVRSLMTDAELKIMADQKDATGKNILQMLAVKDVEGAGDGEFSDEFIEQKELIGVNVSKLEKNVNHDGKLHEVHICYMDYDFSGDGVTDKNSVFVLIDRKILVRADKNPFWHGMKPYISGSYFPRPNQWEGTSLIQPVRKIQYEINDFRNLGLDGAKMSLTQNWIVSDDSGIEDDQIRISQGGVITVTGDVNKAIKQVVFPDLSRVGVQVEAIMEANMREATGVTRAVQGVTESGPRQTATQFSQMLAQAGDRTRLSIETFGLHEWNDCWTMAHSLNQQMLRKATFVRLTEAESMGFEFFGTPEITGDLDENGEIEIIRQKGVGEVNQEDLALNFDFVINTFGEVELENLRNSNILTFLQLVQSFPPTPENRTFFNLIIRKYWVDVLKMPVEELYDDKGEFILLTPPGAASIFDSEIQADKQLGLDASASEGAAASAETDAIAAAQGGGGGAGDLDPNNLGSLQAQIGGIQNGGNQ